MDIKSFLNESYTAYHAAANICSMLASNGFEQLAADGEWTLSRGGKYYVSRNGSSVVAFVVGYGNAFNICECHTDSPCLKIKGNKLAVTDDLQRLNTEKYGGGLLYTFADRQLKVAGRLLVQTEEGVRQQLVVSPYSVVIPSLAIHHNPAANDSLAFNAQNDALPLFSQSETELYSSLTDERVLDADLYVVPDGCAFNAGVDDEFLCSPRLDNLTSAYACVQAITQVNPVNIAVIACLDNEETGSATRQGAPSFVRQVLQNIEISLGMTTAECNYSRENGMVLSVDNGHASHPAHPEKNDPYNRVHLNGGVLIKHNVNYATDGLTSAILKRILNDCDLPYQDFYNRSDVRCGSTLGLATARELGMKVCDIGIAQLAMHSACETCGSNDVTTIALCLESFLSADISGSDNIAVK